MANGYIVGAFALFVVYSLVHHKKTAFYEEDNNEIENDKNTCERYFGKPNFTSKEEQNEIYPCFEPENYECNKTDKYRTILGYCNNLENPLWGSGVTAYVRIAGAYYDGYFGLRKGINGGELPLVRKISTEIFNLNRIPLSKDKTMLLTAFAQIIAHDVGNEAAKQGEDCCTDIERGTDDFMKTCCQIDIPDDDPFYSKINTTCINLRRHQSTYIDWQCDTLKYSYPLTRVSSYLDLSFLYGYDNATSEPLREYVGGKLVANYTDDGQTVLLVEGGCPAQAKIPERPICFTAGDARINQNPEVVIYTAIFLRAHNYIAGQLEKLHPDWDDTTLFEEARRINIAAYQRVVYNEFLPAIIGKENCQRRGFLEEKEGYSDQYDPEVNAHTIASFSTGVYRAFHTLQTGNVTMRNNEYEPTGHYRVVDHMNDQSFLVTEPHMYTQIINGLARNRAVGKIGEYASFDFLNLCFKSQQGNITDLYSVDISRGRDDGIPPYNEMRRRCGLCPFTSFDQLGESARSEDWKKLEKLYDNIEDVDLLVGVFLETAIPNSVYGPTGQCIFEEQFSRYKKGDRFFYEYNNEHVSFTEVIDFRGCPQSFMQLSFVHTGEFYETPSDVASCPCSNQLKSIKQVTFSGFFCIAQNNSELQIQQDSFHQPSSTNPMKKCADVPFVDLTLF